MMSVPPARTLSDAFDVLLFDLDGVIYIGADPVPYAVDSLNAARAAGNRLGFLTNNASRRTQTVADHLTRLGIRGVTAADVVSSPEAAVPLLAQRIPAGAEVLVVGGDGLRWEVENAGFRITTVATPDTAGVIQGFTPELTWNDLAEASYAIEAGAVWVGTNGDWTIPREKGVAPGNGTLLAAVHTATGKFPEVAGKPERPIYDVARRRFAATRPLAIGDRLDTDILGAHRGEMDSLLVLTGVDTPLTVLRADPDQRPTYIARDLRALNEYYEPAVLNGNTAECGTVSARLDRAILTITHGDVRSVEALRAACALVWTSNVPPTAIQVPAGLGAGE